MSANPKHIPKLIFSTEQEPDVQLDDVIHDFEMLDRESRWLVATIYQIAHISSDHLERFCDDLHKHKSLIAEIFEDVGNIYLNMSDSLRSDKITH